MSFLESRFPDRIAMHAIGGPGFQTPVVVFGSGYESRNIDWSKARGKWEVSQAAKLQTDWELLAAFFRVVQGRGIGFRLKDWTDFSARQAEGVIITVSGVKQLHKRFTYGAITYDHPIYKPVTDAGKAADSTIRGTSVTLVGGGTVDYRTGIVTGTPTAWYGDFDKPARFDTDEMRGEIADKTHDGQFIMNWESIPIVETRLET